MRFFWTTTLLLFSVVLARAQCGGITLTVSDSTVCAPGIVKYQVYGAPSGSSYSWDIGNGQVSGTDTFYGFHTTPETVDVEVVIDFPSGGSCTITENGAVQVYNSPTPSLSVSRTKLCDGPDTISLECNNTNTSSISWVVDGTNYPNYGSTLTHLFKSSGMKDVYLIVVDNNGCRGILEEEDLVNVRNPVQIDFDATNKSGCVPQKVDYTPSVQLNGETIENASWTFEGANLTNHEGLNPPQLNYSLAGNFKTTLTIETSAGCFHTEEKDDFVGYGRKFNPAIEIADNQLCTDEQVLINTVGTNEGNYIWTIAGATFVDTPSLNELIVSFQDSGTYDVDLEHTYNGCISNAKRANAIKVDFVKARFYLVDQFHCQLPHTVQINDSRIASSYTNAGSLSYEWNIYDENNGAPTWSSTQRFDSFTATDWGLYSVELIVENSNQCRDTTRRTNYIRVDSIRPNFNAVPNVACINQPITFNSTTPPSSYQSPDTFYWEFFDLNGNLDTSASGNRVTHSYDALGKYDVKLYAGNFIGCVDTLRREEYIEIIQPVLDFSTSTPVVCEGETIRLSEETEPATANFTHKWIITPANNGQGPTITESGRTPSFTINQPGIYDVMYIASINGGCEDTLVKEDFLYVNGIRAEIQLDSSNGCEDLIVNASSSILYDYSLSAPNTGASYEWSSPQGNLVTFSDPYASNTTISFDRRAAYEINLTITNSAGCSYDVDAESVVIGVLADMDVPTDHACVNGEMVVTSKSRYKPTKEEWTVVPASFNVDLNVIDDTAVVIPREAGVFTLRLVASKYGTCFDTTEHEITSIKVNSSFTMADSQLYCAPAYAQFTATSTNADSFFWDFGDGKFVETTDREVANIYNKNSGWSDGFDITLISKSVEGCTDTLIVEDGVKVAGPVPQFEIQNEEGCEPLEVTFIDKSIDVFKYYLNFGDGSPLDSTTFSSHTYEVQSSNATDVFVPSLYGIDSLGCVSVVESEVPVTVHRSPTLNLAPMDTSGCVPFNFEFEDITVDVTDYSWTLNGNEISTASSGSEILLDSGAHLLKLTAENANGCVTEFEQTVYARALPVVEIVPTFPRCLGVAIEFAPEVQQGGDLVEWEWMFGDETTMDDTSSAEYPNWTYTTPGIKMATLNVVSEFGCEGSFSRDLNISDPSNIPEGDIEYVTFTEDGDIEIIWYAVENLEIELSSLYRDDLIDALASVNETSVQTYFDDLPQAAPHCYHVRHRDACDFESDNYEIHCPIWLTTSANNPFEIDLNWTAYIGWDRIDAYEVYRMDEFGVAERIAVVESTVLSYTDDKLCSGDFTYFIVALRDDAETRSNNSTSSVIYNAYTDAKSISLVTVSEDEEFVDISWEGSVNPAWNNFILRKYDPSDLTNPVDEIELSGTNYSDFNVNTDANSYIYKIAEQDHCGLETVDGYQGRSILLEGSFNGVSTSLSWNAYEEWETGVQKYIVQFNGINGYETLAELGPNELTYTDLEFHNEVQGAYCYRILAISNNTTPDTSMSNSTCTVGESVVWVPTAFTPNGNGLNETFKPISQFTRDYDDGTYREYRFEVFNRWGQMVFTSENMEEGWDGTFMGREAPQGVYMYHATITGIDAKVHAVSGQVTLLR